ncbi:glutathione-disulfide reductase [Comamonas composti]|uniref:glutathione-disulfide reductase n=1 Tax=Comamonas composti TaxID=408558 RepID=UPI000405E7F4|nr:glutathione-disulfide reductase [Comamonas composti]
MPYDFDLVVIGAGSGGVRASRVAASLGARVAVVEAARPGGTCVNMGCIPKKLFSHAARFGLGLEEAPGFGWSLEPAGFDWPTLIAGKNREIQRLNGIYEQLLAQAGVQLIAGRARITGPHSVAVGETTLSARHILVATGGQPQMPAVQGLQWAISSDQAFDLPALPRRVVVVGGGYIAMEFASIFNGLGARTTLVHRSAQLLRHFDDELGQALAARMQDSGVHMQLGREIRAIARQADGTLHLQLDDDQTLHTDCLLFATGRTPNTQGLGLQEVGVELDGSGAIVVDQGFTTRIPSIHAVGDVVGRMALTPVALAEATALAHQLFGAGDKTAPDYALVPTAVFSHPNVATVGLSEAQARAHHEQVQVFKSSFRPLTNRLAEKAQPVFLKLVVGGPEQRVLGVHMVGDEAGELIQGFAVALQCRATKAQFDATLGIHPSVAEEFVTMRTPVG